MQTLGVAIVGLGRSGWGMQLDELDAMPAEFRVVAACDPIRHRRDMFGQRYPHAVVCERIEDLIVRPEVDLVSIASRTNDHVPQTLLALRAGKHVLVEKPMAATLNDALQVADACATASSHVFVRHNRRFEPEFQTVLKLLTRGHLGAIHTIKMRRHGFDHRHDWQAIASEGGGQLLNWGTHMLDQALVFLNEPVHRVWGECKRINSAGDAEDHFRIVLVGDTRTVDVESSAAVAIAEPRIMVFGNRGALVSDGRTIRQRYLDPNRVTVAPAIDAGVPDPGYGGSASALTWLEEDTQIPLDDQFSCKLWGAIHETLRRGKPFPVTLDHAMDILRLITLIQSGDAEGLHMELAVSGT